MCITISSTDLKKFKRNLKNTFHETVDKHAQGYLELLDVRYVRYVRNAGTHQHHLGRSSLSPSRGVRTWNVLGQLPCLGRAYSLEGRCV